MLERIISEAPRFFTYYNMVFLLEAMGRTLLMTLIGVGLGFAFGFLLDFARRTPGRAWLPLRLLATLYVETFRRIPFLVILFIVLFAFQGFRFSVSLFGVAMIAICVISAAFCAEIIRAGFDSIHQTQWDTAAVMNFGRLQTLFHVVLPQAWRVILPPAFAFMVMFIKDTALASQLGVVELTFAGKVLSSRGFSAILVFGTVLVLYFALSYPLSRLGGWLERRLAPSHRR